MGLNQKSVTDLKREQWAASLDYSKIAKSSSFQRLLKSKKNFILPFSLFFLAFYFTLPILTAYSKVLNNPAVGAISWAWVFAFAQFIMTWTLCIIYSNKAAGFDKIVEEVIEETRGARRKNA
ncbi:DUF485 domain-containing protein [Bacillus canaveralius]|uniref:DUF485 domain-containing protein n=1 Tax=Bacillus canaveralius TaxID=1403243 RepID=A0A2N5GSA9_9BACI|nr:MULTISPECIES: DUF485 domain-containing protein [Bacillus]PLR86534.1 DUF485 domain-containing protein [Bacillus canaveralius]PLR87837.1 DUF485 domain-containing protein [Bacillus sp. V33-4]PLS00305.1 DUF485 domain-containing protein [Bacillus canaveralius]RSK55286.1 DUF485 domain-containing protein [Bacillus canaveralius]